MPWSTIRLSLFALAAVLAGVAGAQPEDAATHLLDSPVKVEFSGFGAELVRSAPWAGTGNFGICEDLSDQTLWGTDLNTATIYHYDKALLLLGSIPGIPGVQSGIAYDPSSDTLWVVDYLNGMLIELDKLGAPTGSTVSLALTGGSFPGPLTIDPTDPAGTFWLEDLLLDTVFQLDLGGAILASHPNPQGSGVFGNGLSYDAFDSAGNPGDLHITSGTTSEAQVSRIWGGQPSAPTPRPYSEIVNIAQYDAFVNGIQNTSDPSSTPNEVWYLQGNASNTIIEVLNNPIPAIYLCAPGAVNAGLPMVGTVFSDDMESGALPHWSHGAVLGTDDWAVRSTTYARSGSNAWTCIDDPTYTDKHLDLMIDLAGAATLLTFWHTYYFEAPDYDGAILEISVDGGATFTQLATEFVSGGYTGTIQTNFGNPLSGLAAWIGGTYGEMTRVEVDLSGWAPATGAIVRFRVGTDSCCGPAASGGWQIDDVTLSEPTPCAGEPNPVLFVNRLASVTASFDDMESGVGGWWSHGAAVGWDDWAIRTTSYAHSPSHAWTCIADLTYTDKYLDFTVDLAAPYTDVWFWHTYAFEIGNYDGSVLEISVDGGASFYPLDSQIYEGGYTGTIGTGFGNPLSGRAGWVNGSFASMSQVKVDLSSFAPATGAILRFRAGFDSCCGPGASGGWQIDDVSVMAPGSDGTGGEDYTVVTGATQPLTIAIDEAPGRIGDGGTSRACVYAWVGEPGDGDVVEIPKGLGKMCFGPWIIRTRNPKKIWNAIGQTTKLGASNMPNPPVIPDGGTFFLVNKPGGVGFAAVATFQGVIQDPCSQGSVPFSITNGIKLVLGDG